MRCPRCGNDIDDNARYCPHCGVALIKCPYCHRLNLANSNYCQYCGTSLNTRVDDTFQNQYHYQPRYQYNGEPVGNTPTPAYTNKVPDDPNVNKKVEWKKVIIAILVLALVFCVSQVYLETTPKITLKGSGSTGAQATITAEKLSQNAKLSNLGASGNYDSDGQYVYMTDDDGHLVRLNKNFKSKQTIATSCTGYINLTDDHLYYTNGSHQLCAYDLKTKEIKILVTDRCYYVVYYRGMIFYQDDTDNESMYAYDTKTRKSEKLVNDHVYCINPSDEYIYYTTKTGIGAFSVKEKKAVTLLNASVTSLVYSDHYLYYCNSDNEVIRYDVSTKQSETMAASAMGTLLINDQYLYYYTSQAKIEQVNLSTKAAKTVYSGSLDSVYDYQLTGTNLIVKDEDAWITVNVKTKKQGKIF